MLNTTWLNTFIHLVEIGHFTRTAESLYMTQPGVSQHIKKLESACGCPLLIREGKEFELTGQGKAVYEYGKNQQEQQKSLLEQLQYDDPNAGECRIGCSGAMALKLYPELIAIQKQYPGLTFSVETAPQHSITAGVLNGELDAGIVTSQPDSPKLSAQQVSQESLCLVLPAEYKDKTIDQQQLSQLGLINHPDGMHYLGQYLQHSSQEPFGELDISQVPVRGYINQLHQILLPVSQGLGFTVLPESAVQAFARPEELYVYPPKKPLTESLYLIYKKNRELPARYGHLVGCFG